MAAKKDVVVVVGADTSSLRKGMGQGSKSVKGFGRASRADLKKTAASIAKLGAAARAAIVDRGLIWENTARRVVALARQLTESSGPDPDRIVE